MWSSVAEKYTAKTAVRGGIGRWGGGTDPWEDMGWELDDKLTNKGKVEVVQNWLPLVVMSFTRQVFERMGRGRVARLN